MEDRIFTPSNDNIFIFGTTTKQTMWSTQPPVQLVPNAPSIWDKAVGALS
jgi:hypothetical protein